MRKLRISAISFLNTAPLMWDFEHGEHANELSQAFEISYTVPSLCAEALRSGEADIGIIPAITYQDIPELKIIPDVAIAARGAVRSILLVSKVPLENIRAVAVDTSSRTSVALLEILFRKGWIAPGRKSLVPHFFPMKPELEAMLSVHDAALLIGDSALRVDPTQYQVMDLAEAWRNATGNSFVFAFWAVRKEAAAEFGNDARLKLIFQQSRNNGLSHTHEIAEAWSQRVSLTNEEIVSYLTQNIRFSLGREELAGLNHFFGLAQPNPRPLEFLGFQPALEPSGTWASGTAKTGRIPSA